MRRSDEDDRALVEAARGGDQHARDRLVAAYLPLVYNVVGRALDGHADVDDVVQETMLRCLRALWDLRDPGRFRAWLVAIAVRQVRERHRHRATAATQIGDRADDLADPGADFADLTVLRLEPDRAAPRGGRRDPVAGHRPPRAAGPVVAGGGRRAVPRRPGALARAESRARGRAGAADARPARRRPGGGPRPQRGAALRRPRRRGGGVGRAAGSVVAQAVRPAHPHVRGVRGGLGVAGGGRPAAGRVGAGAGAGRAARPGCPRRPRPRPRPARPKPARWRWASRPWPPWGRRSRWRPRPWCTPS